MRCAPRIARSACRLLALVFLNLLLSIAATITITAAAQHVLPPAPHRQPSSHAVVLTPNVKRQLKAPIFPNIIAQLAAVSEVSNTGVLIETLDGRVIKESSTQRLFNPASAMKLATALVALKSFGPHFRFATVIWTNGVLDPSTGTINGDLFLSGRDPALHDEHVVIIARELNRLGIKTVTGDLYVPPSFSLNFDASAKRAAGRFYDTLDVTLRPPSATRALLASTAAATTALGEATTTTLTSASVAVMGDVYIGAVTSDARPLLTHKSSALVDILKVLLCYSNNFMADRLGDSLGGPRAIERLLITQLGIRDEEINVASASGLGSGRVTPRVMMKIYRALLNELSKSNLSASDIMPVAGIDAGTLRKRFTGGPSQASVIAKTGTLPRTDGGVSALVGETHLRSGETLLFVIFNQRGSAGRFRASQDMLITAVQHERGGGPAAFNYNSTQIAMRLADTQMAAPSKNQDGEEF